MIPARPIIITLLLAAGAGSARGGDQGISGLQSCIDNARQADATCSKLTDDPARRLDCFDRARNEQLACLQRALPDAASKTTATEGDRRARPHEAAPKAAASDAPAQPAPQKSQQAKVPDHPREEAGPAQDNLRSGPQIGAQKNAPKPPPPSAASNAVEPATNSTGVDAPADTASITANAKPAPQPSAAPAVQSPPPARQADALSEAKEPAKEPAKETTKETAKDSVEHSVKAPAKSEAPTEAASSNRESAKPAPQPPVAQTAENPPAARQADAPSEPKEPAKDAAKASIKTDAQAETASNNKGAKPAPQPPITQNFESPAPAHQADAPSEPKEPAKDTAKASTKTDAPTEAASSKESAKPAPQPPATQAVENPPPARQADIPSEPKEPAKDMVQAPAKTDATTEAASSKESAKPAPQPPAIQATESPPPARKAEPVSEPKEPAKSMAKDTTQDLPKTSDKTSDKTSAKTPDKTPATTAVAPAAKPSAPNWLVSEMPSPIDYRPLLTAVLHPTSSSDGGPANLTIRCLGGQTALSIHTEGTWRAVRKNALTVDHQINEQSAVRQMWTLSADAKTATYSGDTTALLRSFPEGTQLTINVPDGANAKHDATFQLIGWDTVRKRIGTACKWSNADAQALSGKR